MQSVRTIFPTVQEARTARSNSINSMEGKFKGGQTLRQPPTKLALADLRTVRWAQEQQGVMTTYQSIANFYLYLRKLLLVGFFFVLAEAVVVWWWTFLHNLPWPQAILNLIDRLDSAVVYVLDAVQQRLEWVSDSIKAFLSKKQS